MINLDQIQILEKKVNNAVETINRLTQENKALKRTIENSQSRMHELENLLDQFKNEQDQIEKGILNALHQLDNLEDSLDPEENPEAVATLDIKNHHTQKAEQNPKNDETFLGNRESIVDKAQEAATKETPDTEDESGIQLKQTEPEKFEGEQDLLFDDSQEDEGSPSDSITISTENPSQQSILDADEEEEETELDIF